jgi:hypothetical protein
MVGVRREPLELLCPLSDSDSRVADISTIMLSSILVRRVTQGIARVLVLQYGAHELLGHEVDTVLLLVHCCARGRGTRRGRALKDECTGFAGEQGGEFEDAQKT